MMNLNDLGISNQGDKVRFAAYGHLPPVDITGTVSGLLQQLQSFFAALPRKWADQMLPLLEDFERSENACFMENLAVSVSSCFANLLPEQLQRFGNALVEAACKAAHGDSEGWHGMTTRRIEALTGLSDFGAKKKPEETAQAEVAEAVREAAALIAAHVREAFAVVGAVEKTKDGGVSPEFVNAFLFCVKRRPGVYGRALRAIKELQRLWRFYFPKAEGVLVWPRKRKRWMIRIGNSNFSSLRPDGKGGYFKTWSDWFVAHQDRSDFAVEIAADELAHLEGGVELPPIWLEVSTADWLSLGGTSCEDSNDYIRLNVEEFVKVWSCRGDHPKDIAVKVSSSALVRLAQVRQSSEFNVRINLGDLQRLQAMASKTVPEKSDVEATKEWTKIPFEELKHLKSLVPLRSPGFDRFVGVEGGILTDGFRFSLYGKRGKAQLQRTAARTASHLKEKGVVDKVKQLLDHVPTAPGPPQLDAEPLDKKPKLDDFTFTGILTMENAVKKGVIDMEFFDGRAVLVLDPGGKYGQAGAFVRDWEIASFFRVSSRDFFRQTGRDKVQQEGVESRERLGGNVGCERALWERFERASDEVLHKAPDVRKWAEEYELVAQHQKTRAKAQSRVWTREQEFLHEMLRSIQSTFQEMGGTKCPVIVMGRDEGKGQGVRGTRGHCSTALQTFLAQFFLILTVGEHNTTKLCPCCHRETVFAKRSEIRSKKCKHGCGWKDTNGIHHDFCYDRDFGAVSDFVFLPFVCFHCGLKSL